MIRSLKNIWELVSQSFKEWSNDKAAQLAAAIAYYTIFSIPPLLIIALDISGYFINSATAKNQLIAQIAGLAGQQTADFIKSLIENPGPSATSPIASLISIVVLLLGASGVFNQVQSALNTMWDVPQKQGRNLIRTLVNHFLSFLTVLAIGFLFLAFLILSAVISVLSGYMGGGAQNAILTEVINSLVLLALITVMVAMIYRVVPDKEISWGDVWLGAVVTALLFMLGRYAIGLYLSYSKSASAYGAAGSLIVLLLWVYYSAQIFLLGAEFTQVYARKFGSRKPVEANPAPMDTKTPVRQSLHPQE